MNKETPKNEELENLIRDLTKVGSIPKSEARRRILEFAEAARKENVMMIESKISKEFWEKSEYGQEMLEAARKQGEREGLNKGAIIGSIVDRVERQQEFQKAIKSLNL